MGAKRSAAAVLLLAVALAGCSASAEKELPMPAATCDGGAGVRRPEQAVTTLLEAARHADAATACTVTTGTPEGVDLSEELAQLADEARERGLTPDNLRLAKLGGGGPAGRYAAEGADAGLGPLEFELVQLQDGGYRVVFPPLEELNL